MKQANHYTKNRNKKSDFEENPKERKHKKMNNKQNKKNSESFINTRNDSYNKPHHRLQTEYTRR